MCAPCAPSQIILVVHTRRTPGGEVSFIWQHGTWGQFGSVAVALFGRQGADSHKKQAVVHGICRVVQRLRREVERPDPHWFDTQHARNTQPLAHEGAASGGNGGHSMDWEGRGGTGGKRERKPTWKVRENEAISDRGRPERIVDWLARRGAQEPKGIRQAQDLVLMYLVVEATEKYAREWQGAVGTSVAAAIANCVWGVAGGGGDAGPDGEWGIERALAVLLEQPGVAVEQCIHAGAAQMAVEAVKRGPAGRGGCTARRLSGPGHAAAHCCSLGEGHTS